MFFHRPSFLHWLLATALLFNSFGWVARASAETFGPNDRLTDTDYSYDANGNVLATPDGRAYTYNTAGRLVGVQSATGSDAYTYDGRGNLITLTENGTTTDLVIDERVRHPTILGEVSSNGRAYAYGPGGLHAQKKGGSVQYALRDSQGTIRHMTDAAGTVTHTRHYNAWGARRHQTTADGPTLGYTGERETAAGSLYLRARHYNPRTGRFLQRDSIDAGFYGQGVQGHNRYAYVNNNPANYADPSGHLAPLAIAAIGLSVISGMLLAPPPVNTPTMQDVREKKQPPAFRVGDELAALAADLAIDRIPDATIGRYGQQMIEKANQLPGLLDNLTPGAGIKPGKICKLPKNLWAPRKTAAGGTDHYTTRPVNEDEISDLVDDILSKNPNADITIYTGTHGTSGNGALVPEYDFALEDLFNHGMSPNVDVQPLDIGHNGFDLYDKMGTTSGDCIFAWCYSSNTRNSLDDFFERGQGNLESLGMSDPTKGP